MLTPSDFDAFNYRGKLTDLFDRLTSEIRSLAARTRQEHRAQVQVLLEQHKCDSATTRQLTENFIRAANKQAPAQQAGIKFAGAGPESDAPTQTGTPPPAFSPVALSAQDQNARAANAAFGGGGLFGEDWKNTHHESARIQQES